MPELHPDIAILAPLLGTWSGTGSGEYPTIEPFEYVEEVTFGHVGKPFLTYNQRTRAADDNRPLHAETGYLRLASPDRVEWMLAHPFGITEILQGTLSTADGEFVLDLTGTTIGRTDTAKDVEATRRFFRLNADSLSYNIQMAAVGVALRHHLSAVLHRNDV